MTFPPDFLWGTAGSAYQVEGNNTNTDWWAFEQHEGAIVNGDRAGQACDWWENAEQDLDIAAGRADRPHRPSACRRRWARA